MPSTSLPSSVDAATLPAALPTIAEIYSSEDVLMERSSAKVVGVGEHFIVKYGFGVSLREGDSMRFIKESTSIPVPTLYASFEIFEPTDTSRKKTFLIMERIRGGTLQSIWSKLDVSTKKAVVSKLKDFFNEMRKLESPGGYCALGGRALPDRVFYDNPVKVFDNESDLHEAIVENYLGNPFNAEYGTPKYQREWYSRAFKSHFQNHPPTFSHGDVQRKNIIIRNYKIDQSDLEKLEVVLIDWESAGWYPSYWEYAIAIYASGRWDDDWSIWVESFLVPAYAEFAMTSLYLQDRPI
ncbi:MAG: hypothetical protein Q9160_009347 [Pyrenula sp. 1 TL-2023]